MSLEGQEVVYLRFNPEEASPAKEYDLRLRREDGSPVWIAHPDPEIDVAIVTLNARQLREDGIRFQYFRNDQHVADREKAKELGITEGDGVYALGSPLELIGGERNFVIVRQGAIARIRDALEGLSNEFLVDISIFPRNSGGPLVNKPDLTAIEGTNSVNAAYLLGVVRGYLPYEDVAVSLQTQRPRVVFQENSGLAAVIPIDLMTELVEKQLSLTEQAEPGVPTSPEQVVQETPPT
jgi:S1-C subfamily serine protease